MTTKKQNSSAKLTIKRGFANFTKERLIDERKMTPMFQDLIRINNNVS